MKIKQAAFIGAMLVLAGFGGWALYAQGEELLDGDPVIVTSGNLTTGDNGTTTNIRMVERASAPSAPAAGRWSFYPKSAGLYQLDDVGTELRLATAADIAGFVSGSGVDDYIATWNGTTGLQSQGLSINDSDQLIFGSPLSETDPRIYEGTVETGTIVIQANEGLASLVVGTDAGVRITPGSQSGAGGKLILPDWTVTPTGNPDTGEIWLYYDAAGSFYLEDDTGTQTDLMAGGGGSPLTTKGDLYTYDTADARLPVGTNGYALTPDSAQSLGIKWAAPFSLAADIGTPQTILIGDTLDIEGGDGIGTTAGATDKVTVAVDSTVVRGSGTKTSDTTVVNTTTKTAVYSWTVAAGDWADLSQNQLSLYMRGTAFTGTPTLTMTIEDGTNTLATYTFSSLASGSFAAHVEAQLTCRSTGASGTVEGVGIAQAILSAGTAFNYWAASNVDTTDTTASNTYTVYLQWSAANAFNSMTVSSAGVIALD